MAGQRGTRSQRLHQSLAQVPIQKIGRTSSHTRARSWLWLPLSLKVSARTLGLVSPMLWTKMLLLQPKLKHSREPRLALDWDDICMTYRKISGYLTTIPPDELPSLRLYLIGLFQRSSATTATNR